MKLSIMFITRNRKHELIRAIDSCLKHRIEDMEFIIVDNNSDDETQEYVKEFLKMHNVKYSYYYSNENLGVAGGRNKAFSLAKGDYVFSLDDDAVIETKDFFRKVCTKMDASSNVVAAAVKIYEPVSKKYLIGRTFNSNSNDYQGFITFSFFGGAHILRKDFYKQKKLYPDKLGFGSEEFYPSLAAHKENKLIAYFEDLKVLHLPSNISHIERKDRIISIILNTHIIRKLYYPIIVHPVLELFLRMRILKHVLYDFKSFRRAMKLCKLRYDPQYINRMSVDCFCRLTREFGLRSMF